MTKSKKDYAVIEPFVRAFASEFTAIWGGTQFQEEVDNLAYFRALTCWLNATHYDMESRREYMYRYLESDFSTTQEDDTLNELYRLLPIETSVRRIMRNLCGLYNKPSRRKFESKQAEYENLYTIAQVDSAMRNAHIVGRLTNNALIMPVVRNNKLEIDVFPPDLYRVKVGDTDFRSVVELWIPVTRHGVTEFHVWGAETYRRVKNNGDVISEEANRYGRIPGVFLQFDKDPADYYGGGLFEIVMATLDCNKLKFLADNNVTYTGFAVWVAINFGKSMDSARLSPNRLLRVDNVAGPGDGGYIEPDLRSVAPDSNYMGIEELRDVRYQRALRNEGLPLSLYSANPGIASGYALFIERQELIEIRAIDMEKMRHAENELCELISVVVSADMGLNLPVSALGVDYSDVEIVMEPDKSFELKKQQFEYGLIPALEFVRQLSGNDLVDTDESAIEYMKKNRELFKQLSGDNNGAANGGISQPDNAANPGQEAANGNGGTDPGVGTGGADNSAAQGADSGQF